MLNLTQLLYAGSRIRCVWQLYEQAPDEQSMRNCAAPSHLGSCDWQSQEWVIFQQHNEHQDIIEGFISTLWNITGIWEALPRKIINGARNKVCAIYTYVMYVYKSCFTPEYILVVSPMSGFSYYKLCWPTPPIKIRQNSLLNMNIQPFVSGGPYKGSQFLREPIIW